MDKYYPYEPLQFDNTNLTKKTLEIKPIYLMYSRLLFQRGNIFLPTCNEAAGRILDIKSLHYRGLLRKVYITRGYAPCFQR